MLLLVLRNLLFWKIPIGLQCMECVTIILVNQPNTFLSCRRKTYSHGDNFHRTGLPICICNTAIECGWSIILVFGRLDPRDEEEFQKLFDFLGVGDLRLFLLWVRFCSLSLRFLFFYLVYRLL